jgi:hypothetical protein
VGDRHPGIAANGRFAAAAGQRRRRHAMNRAWIVLWAVVVLQVAAWTFAPAPAPSAPQILEVNRGKAFGPNEDITVEGRSRQRQAVFATLERPWGGRCAGESRKAFISGLNEYYYHRQNQTERYPETYGKLGADYIAKQWSSTDDQRIDRLTQDAYAKGYLKPEDFEPVARKLIAGVVKDERVTGKACAS